MAQPARTLCQGSVACPLHLTAWEGLLPFVSCSCPHLRDSHSMQGPLLSLLPTSMYPLPGGQRS